MLFRSLYHAVVMSSVVLSILPNSGFCFAISLIRSLLKAFCLPIELIVELSCFCDRLSYAWNAVNNASAADPIAITVTFSKSASSNGSSITSYEIVGTAEDNSTVTCSVNVTDQSTSSYTCDLHGTKSGLNYKVKVRAYNAAGPSSWSSETSDVKPGIAQTITLSATKTVAITSADFNVDRKSTRLNSSH